MKKRVWALLIITIFIFIALLTGFSIGIPNRRIVGALSIIWIAYLIIIIFGGLAKFIVALIYGIITAVFLLLFSEYGTAFVLIGTLLFVLNPLADLENFIEKKFPNRSAVISQIRGSYKPFYEYRKEVKNYYHLPQMRKVHTKPNYLKLRQAVSILMSALAVFLLINELSSLVDIIDNPFNIHAFSASTYSVIVLIVLTVILYRKGFQSMLNFLTVSIFPPIAYYLYVSITPLYLGAILGTVTILIGIGVAIYEYISFRRRVVYEYYHYYDNNKQAEVYANALFEPFVYNDAFYLVTEFEIKTNLNNFHKHFHLLLGHSNFNRFFITAYTYDRKAVKIHADFHYRDEKKIEKFVTLLESIFEDEVKHKIYIDKEKSIYEKMFFHNQDYIVARTIYLAELLKELEIKSNVIISMVAYFSNIDNIRTMSKTYAVTRLPDLDMKNVLTVRIDVKVNNIDYVIDAKVREILLDLLINNGKYVRINVYY